MGFPTGDSIMRKRLSKSYKWALIYVVDCEHIRVTLPNARISPMELCKVFKDLTRAEIYDIHRQMCGMGYLQRVDRDGGTYFYIPAEDFVYPEFLEIAEKTLGKDLDEIRKKSSLVKQ